MATAMTVDERYKALLANLEEAHETAVRNEFDLPSEAARCRAEELLREIATLGEIAETADVAFDEDGSIEITLSVLPRYFVTIDVSWIEARLSMVYRDLVNDTVEPVPVEGVGDVGIWLQKAA